MAAFRLHKRHRLYLWVALAAWGLSVLTSLSDGVDTLGAQAVNSFWRLVYLGSLHYVLFEHVIPYLRNPRKGIVKRVVAGVFFLWIFLMFYSFGMYAWRLIGIGMGIWTPLKGINTISGDAVAEQMGFSMGSLVYFGLVIHIHDYVALRNAAQQWRIEKQQAELNFLKAQTNPHFLFNTLNNIYVLAREKSDQAAESVMRLSKMLRYMLYEATSDYIPVEKEIRLINDYLELEKLRYDESLRVSFHHDIEDMNQAVPPLMLIPLVENAFTHGVSETPANPYIDIHISIRQRQLQCVVKNSYEGTATDKPVVENIGLGNLRRQLQLLYGEYELRAIPARGVFTTTLTINLASHV